GHQQIAPAVEQVDVPEALPEELGSSRLAEREAALVDHRNAEDVVPQGDDGHPEVWIAILLLELHEGALEIVEIGLEGEIAGGYHPGEEELLQGRVALARVVLEDLRRPVRLTQGGVESAI